MKELSKEDKLWLALFYTDQLELLFTEIKPFMQQEAKMKLNSALKSSRNFVKYFDSLLKDHAFSFGDFSDDLQGVLLEHYINVKNSVDSKKTKKG